MEIHSIDKDFEVKHGETLLLTAKISLPKVGGRTKAARRINSYYSAELRFRERYARKTLAKSAKKQYDFMEKYGFIFEPFKLNITFTVTLNDENTLSLYTDCHEYVGGASAVTVRAGDIWTNGFPVHIEVKGREKRAARRKIVSEIERRRAWGEPYFVPPKRFARKHFNDKRLYLTPDGVTAFFQDTTIAPHSSGITEFQIQKGEHHANHSTNETGAKRR